jgi:predicted amidohydrolase YtcJ
MRTLFRNGRIYSSVTHLPSAFVVEDAVISWIGDEDGLAQHAGTRTVDLGGAFVTPAFVDAHVHVTATGRALEGLDLAGSASLREALDIVERAARTGRGRPVIGGGWDETRWPEGRPPTVAELDRAAYGGVVYLARVDMHSAVVSSALLAAVPGIAGLGGYRADGRLAGQAHEAARSVANGASRPGEVRDLQRAALRHAAAQGIACVHEMAGPVTSGAEDLRGLLQLAGSESLPEVLGYWGELLGTDTARELGAVGAGGDLFCDGSLGSHTAALREPYADRPDACGALRFDTATLAEHLIRCARVGLQAGFHAIGDAAVEQVLDAVDLSTAALGRPGGAGHRIEHAEMCDDPGRLAASGLIASVQPGFDAAWGAPEGMYEQRLGRERASRLNRFSDLASAGVPLAFGSDAPVTALGPWAAVRAAAYPAHRGAAISPRSAFTAHTRAGWRAAGRDGEGVLVPGAPATFAVWLAGELGVDAPDERVARWSTDPRSAVPGLPDLSPGTALPTCLATVLRGTTIFDDGLIR